MNPKWTLLPLLLATACSTGAEKNAIETAMANDAQRAKAFEATARALDEHPEYVDELYKVVRKHPPMLQRFLADTAADLRDPELAHSVAVELAKHPASVEETLVKTVDAAAPLPASRAAIDRAITKRHRVMADILSDGPQTLGTTMDDVIVFSQQKEGARASFLASMRRSQLRLSQILESDPETLAELTRTLLKVEAKDPKKLEELVKDIAKDTVKK